ncbi:MAG: TonB-dependent receptor [Bacteroidales bacterium]|nr:TonB-dependent receptor [Bacteroidales bacterium]
MSSAYSILFLSIFLLISKFEGYSQHIQQTVKGKVFDIVTQIPLTGATVILKKDSTIFARIADENGNYRFEKILVGRYSMEFRFIGYETYLLNDVLVTSSKPVTENVGLKESFSEIDEVVLKAQVRKDVPLNPLASISARTFTVEETRRYAGGFDDPGRMAASFAGVAGGNPNDNALSIRGNAPKYVLWRIEGVEVHNPNHFATMLVEGGGVVSMLSAQILSNSDFYTGAFPAEYGNALSGVFDMNLRTGNNEKREWGFQAGTLGIDFFGEGPFIKGKSSSYVFNYRHATTAFMKNFIPEGQLPIYKDFSFKLNFPTNKSGIFSVWMTASIDDNNSDAVEDTSEWKSLEDGIRYTWNGQSVLGGIRHKYIFNSKSWINSSISTSQYDFSDKNELFNSGIYDTVDLTKNYTSKINLTSVITHKFNKKNMNKTGIIVSYNLYEIDIQKKSISGFPDDVFIFEEGNTGFHQFFSQNRWDINSNLSLNYGFHSLWFWLNGSKTFEPRVSLTYKFMKTNTINIAYGNHSQIEPLIIYFAEVPIDSQHYCTPNKILKPSRSNHFIIGYDKSFGEHLRFKTEIYYQHLYHIPAMYNNYYSLINFKKEYFINDSLFNIGNGINKGIDVTIERFLADNYYFLITGSLFDTKYSINNKEYSTRWDYDFAANILAGKEFVLGKEKSNIIGLNIRIAFQGGERAHPVDIEVSKQQKTIIYNYNRLWEERYPNLLFIDFTATYIINKLKYTSTFAVQLKNLTMEKSIYYYQYNIKNNSVELTGKSFIFPNISYKIEF